MSVLVTLGLILNRVAEVKVYLRQNQNNRAHAVIACIGLWHQGAMHAVHACISLWGACIGLWCHRPMHALTAWHLKFQVCLGYTFTPATLVPKSWTKEPLLKRKTGWSCPAGFKHLNLGLLVKCWTNWQQMDSNPWNKVNKPMRLCHPSDGSTSPKYKLLCFKPP